MYCNNRQHNWAEFLVLAEYAQNFYWPNALCVLSQQPPLCPCNATPTNVWLMTQDLRLNLPCKKLSLYYICPYVILAQVNSFNLKLPLYMHILPVFHVSNSNFICHIFKFYSLVRPVVHGPAVEVEGASTFWVLLDC